MEIVVTINGVEEHIDVQTGENLATALRRNGHTEVRTGCDTGSCGLCTVWIDGKPTLSCSTLAVRAGGKQITTIKGLGDEAESLAKHLVAEGADQCGYCSPGFILTVVAMKRELERPSVEEIKHYLNGNLCRCTGYEGQLRAIKKWIEASV